MSLFQIHACFMLFCHSLCVCDLFYQISMLLMSLLLISREQVQGTFDLPWSSCFLLGLGGVVSVVTFFPIFLIESPL
jgi:hypothetical protein